MVQAKNPYIDMLWHHRWLAIPVAALVMVSVFAATSMQPRVYRVSADAYVEPWPGTVIGDAAAQADTHAVSNQVEILHSDGVMRRAAQAVRARLGKKGAVSPEWLQKHLRTQRKGDSTVITVSLTGARPPQTLRTMLEAYLDAYKAELEALNTAQFHQEQRFLQQELAKAQAGMDEAAVALRDFRMTHQIYHLDAQVMQRLQTGARLEQQLKTVQADMAAARREMASLRRQLPAEPETLNRLARMEQDPVTRALRERIVELEMAKSTPSSPLSQGGPAAESGLDLLHRLEGLLAQRLGALARTQVSPQDQALAARLIEKRVALQGLQARSQALSAARSGVLSGLHDVPAKAVELATLQNRFEMAQERMGVLKHRLDEAAMMEAMAKDFARVEILRHPVTPKTPISPNVAHNMLLAALAGVGLGVAAVMVRSALDGLVRRASQAATLLGSEQGVWALPAPVGTAALIRLLEKTRHVVPERYQRFAVSLESLSKVQGMRRIGLVPVKAGIAARQVPVALSLYLTELGHKVVLIDTDFSPQSVSWLLKSLDLPISSAIEAGPGLADYLRGGAEDFIDVIYPLGKSMYGSLIPAGDPGEENRLIPRNLSHLEANLSPNYQFVFYSLPDAAVTSDAMAIGHTLDGVFLLAQAGKTPLGSLQQALRDMQAAHCRVLGILVQAG